MEATLEAPKAVKPAQATAATQPAPTSEMTDAQIETQLASLTERQAAIIAKTNEISQLVRDCITDNADANRLQALALERNALPTEFASVEVNIAALRLERHQRKIAALEIAAKKMRTESEPLRLKAEAARHEFEDAGNLASDAALEAKAARQELQNYRDDKIAAAHRLEKLTR